MEIVRLDNFGRVLIPKNVREQLGLTNATQFSLSIQDDKLVLSPLTQPSNVYHLGSTLVVESQPIGNLETAIDELREEQIRELICSSENPV
ncbi:AbrB/MazE/SpoVT family DNA-binding domain-containing protein [Brasilonema bromeliae]|uniref:AbrB family transcriptional regulator n=1 Tax=Brasilonema bromeliae SPC951 TaxID=385972 RepID=A0ABX1P8R4_9CYAN|nr:AbrB/MazE/SpoVT family DNA-binding domain-containing protein [Brasilonema bromeliae]NMG20408.1 AbrB family transcriptional regulator [Brasilonema bromeliae SPC951]